MKLLPGSLGGQLVILMLCGFVVGSLIGTLGLWSRAGALHPIARDHALSRTVTAYRLARLQPARDTAWLEAFNTAVAHLWIDRRPSDAAMGENERSIAQDLHARLAAPQISVRMPCSGDTQLSALPAHSESTTAVECVEIDLALGDGRWLHTRQALPVQSLWQESWQLLRFSLLVGIPPVLILMYIFVNRILRPTTALTSAAERMSRGERLDPLALDGPDEIREIAVAFNQMHERITRFVDERTRMLAAISHDLRTPLTVLELQAVMLPPSEERSEILRTLEELRQMVNETLDFATGNARAEPGTLADLATLLADVRDRQRAMGREVMLEAPATLRYRCRPLALKRALNNLVENALRHGSQVQVQLQDRGHEGVCIRISDDGPGIPEDMLERVFEPFLQLDESRHRDVGSNVGLGLAIARDCIQAHGGSIQLRNRAQGGLQASIALPPAA